MLTTTEYAQLSASVYDAGGAGNTNANWIRVNPSSLADGFYAATFQNTATGEVVIAYRGTNGPFDAVADIQLVAGQVPRQFNEAVAYYAAVAAQYGAANVSVTGHSLGGAMASFVAASVGGTTTATAFNAPGIANVVVAGSYANVTNYNTFFDPVSNLSANQIGTVNTVVATTVGGLPSWFGAFMGGLGVVPAAITGIANFLFGQHSIDNFLSAKLAQIDAGIRASTGGTYRVVYYSYDPLVLDLDGDGIETVASNGLAGALFDQNGDGIRTATGWVKSDDGLLVRDINGNGSIDNGTEVFGDSTALTAGGKAANGFAALADMDSNGDGVVDASDANFSQLQIWRDLNQNGITDAGELFTLQQSGIQSLNTAAANATPVAVSGGVLAETGSYTRTDGTVSTMGDVSGRVAAQQRGTHRPTPSFRSRRFSASCSEGRPLRSCGCNLTQDTFHTSFTTQIAVPVALQNLPNVGGAGRLCDLRQAANALLAA